MGWTVYIIQCADGSLYTGITTDIQRRLKQHESGMGAKYTRGRGPFRLVYQVSCENKSQATKKELQIKALSREEKISMACV